MSLFKPARNESAFLKMGLMGNAGSGKTLSACLVAIGVVKLARERGLPYANRPVMFLDSENGSDYVLDLFEEAGIDLMVAKTKSFADLCVAMKEAETGASFLIVDSVSAYWDEWKSTYQATKKRSRLQFEDFAAIKQKWRDGFTDRFINSKLHIAMCGRQAWEYDYTVDDETGKKQLEKTDVKMAAEKELGYETSLYVLMERDTDLTTTQVVRNATVLKDRFRVLDGKTFVNPTFNTWAPHILKLNLAGEHTGVDLSRTSADLVPADPRRENYGVRKRIVVDEIEALLLEHGAGGTSNDAKTKRAALVKEHFKTTSKTEIEEAMSLADLEANFDSLHRALTGKASRYGVKEQPPAVHDEIPDFDAAAAAPAVAEGTAAKAGNAEPSPAAPAAAPTAAAAAAAEPPTSEVTASPDDLKAASFEASIAKAPNLTSLSVVIGKARRAKLPDEAGTRVEAAFSKRQAELRGTA